MQENQLDSSEWTDLGRNARAIMGLAQHSGADEPAEVEGRYSAELSTAENDALSRFASVAPLSDSEKQSVYLLLRQNRTAMETLANLLASDRPNQHTSPGDL